MKLLNLSNQMSKISKKIKYVKNKIGYHEANSESSKKAEMTVKTKINLNRNQYKVEDFNVRDG